MGAYLSQVNAANSGTGTVSLSDIYSTLAQSPVLQDQSVAKELASYKGTIASFVNSHQWLFAGLNISQITQ